VTSNDTAHAGETSARRLPVPRLKGLTAKQAGATLLIVVLLGLTGAAFQIYDTWLATRADAREQVARTRDLIETAAVEAAYKLSPRLAGNVVDTLVQTSSIDGARLVTNFDEPLATAGTDPSRQSERANALAVWLFGDITRHKLTLTRRAKGGRNAVGQLNLRLSPAHLYADFYREAARSIVVGTLRALGICILVVGVFYLIITRPLLRVSRAIAAVDPVRPGAFQLDTPRGHAGDEIGRVVSALNNLLSAFQNGLDRRDRAEGELTALNRDLEQRVTERTEALQHANHELEREKAEAERAFRELERAHAELSEANQQIVDSLTYAQRIQAAALPHTDALANSVAELEVWWEPLYAVGGDYVWLAEVDGRSIVLLADCTGHGVPGAFMTLIVAAAMDRLVYERGLREPDEILLALDDLVRQRLRQNRPGTESDEGLDAACCVWAPDRRIITFAGAGLPLIHADGEHVSEIKGDRAHLGYRTYAQPVRLTRHEIDITPATTLYMLSDGVTDQMNAQTRRLFGRRRLRRELQARLDCPLAEQVRALQDILASYRGNEVKRDDIALLAIRPSTDATWDIDTA
jgi:serine phosphatase RsbU (regulator of sigma subunit)